MMIKYSTHGRILKYATATFIPFMNIVKYSKILCTGPKCVFNTTKELLINNYRSIDRISNKVKNAFN